MSRLGRLLRRTRLERELEKELRYHLDRHTQDLVAQGLTLVEALRQAQLAFGGTDQVKEECRDARGLRFVEDLARDLRYGLRQLRRSPLFTAAAVVSLALGIGANTAIFSLMDLVLFRSLPVHQAERLIALETKPYRAIPPDLFRQLRNMRTITGLLAAEPLNPSDIRIAGSDETAATEKVSGSYFEVLGITAQLGRTFTSHPSDATAAVISHSYWKRRFAANPSAIGKTFELDKTTYTILGVAPPGFFGTRVGEDPDITVPLVFDAETELGALMARLRPGATLEQARAEAAAIFSHFPGRDAATTLTADPGGNGFDSLRTRFSASLGILMGIVALVLLIACANIANLLLAKSEVRRREIATRMAIGCGRRRMVRQLFTEGLLLAFFSSFLGLVLAWWFGNTLVTVMSNGDPRIALDVRPDLPLLTFLSLVSLAACVLFSLAPAILATRRIHPQQPAPSRLGRSLIVGQVAFSLVLLIAAALFAQTLHNLYSGAGFNWRNVYVFTLNSQKLNYSDQRLQLLHEQLLATLKARPEVQSATVTAFAPIGVSLTAPSKIEGQPEPVDSASALISPDYFQTIGTPMLEGREFTGRDNPARVAIVNETFARRYFPAGAALGRKLRSNLEIIGVVRDSKYASLRDQTPPVIYTLAGAAYPYWNYLVRAKTDGAALRPLAETLAQSIDPSLHVTEFKTLEQHMAYFLLRERMLAALAVAFASLALLLAIIGIYGVMAFQVARRKREIGIRLALGAQRHSLITMVLVQTARLAAIGAILGIAAARALTPLTEQILYGVAPTDPTTFLTAAAALTLAALAAAWFPGRAAARLDPAETFRCD